MNNQLIYFDNAASTKPNAQAIAAFDEAITENYANPAALHKSGIEAEKLITAAKNTILSNLPKQGTLIFTSGATESNNLALLNSAKPRNKQKIVTTQIEHPSVENAVAQLEKNGYEIVRISPKCENNKSKLHENILNVICKNTALVTMTAVCGETGFITGVDKLYPEIKAKFPDCIVHVDYAQGFMKIPGVNQNPEIGDLLSISAHKIGGIPGIAALFIKDGIRVTPMLFGGGQQNAIRPGTQPTALIAAFAAALKTPNPALPTLKARLITGLQALCMKINTMNDCEYVDNIVNFSCGVKSEVMLHFLAEHNIAVSSGSACARGKKSRILPAYGITEKDIDTAIRVSFGQQNTVKEVEIFLEVLEKGVYRFTS